MARAALAPGGGTSAAPVLPNVKPAWEEDVAATTPTRHSGMRIEGTISSGGHALRPEIRSLLNGAQKDVQTGSYAIQTLDTITLQGALTTLTAKLDKLDKYR